jgi:hypothetical protein
LILFGFPPLGDTPWGTPLGGPPFVDPHSLTNFRDAAFGTRLGGHRSWNPPCGTSHGVTPLRDPSLGHALGPQLVDLHAGPTCGTPLERRPLGTPFRDPTYKNPQWGTTFGGHPLWDLHCEPPCKTPLDGPPLSEPPWGNPLAEHPLQGPPFLGPHLGEPS